MTFISILALLVVGLPILYLLILAAASIPEPKTDLCHTPSSAFIIAIAAHNEANVISASIQKLRDLNYPKDLFSIHVVADHCTDSTASLAEQAGAVVHRRREGPRTGKGAALTWLFQRILEENTADALVIFDADTRVDANFLAFMDARLARGEQFIQGQHRISNPDDGWFPALTSAMFIIDNRYQNLGRSNLGWSVKNMGDSICLRPEILRDNGWGTGLTEDYQLRQRLLLDGVRIAYEPDAIGYGEAPRNWLQAQNQRARWLRGTKDASARYARRLLRAGIKQRDSALIDAALQAYLPSYSTLTLITIIFLIFHVLLNWIVPGLVSNAVLLSWLIILAIMISYPLAGLAIESAPLNAYLAILSGPFYIVWRTWLAIKVRFGLREIKWIRTPHGD